jgi:hypothetical protein
VWPQTSAHTQSGVAPQITVGPNVQVSLARSNITHDEVLMAADPTDAKRLLACSMIGRSPGNELITGAYASYDGGQTWLPVVADERSFDEEGKKSGADPAVAFGPNNIAYFASLTQTGPRSPVLQAWYSSDGGKNWAQSRMPERGNENVDREYFAVDNTNSKYRGRVYIFAQQASVKELGEKALPAGIALWRSLDGGKSFERPVQRFPSDRMTGFQNGNGVVLSDGTFVAVTNQLIAEKYSHTIRGMSVDWRRRRVRYWQLFPRMAPRH